MMTQNKSIERQEQATSTRRSPAVWVLAIVAILCCMNIAFPQAKSRVVGTITDTKTGEKLVGVNVILMDTHLGAVTDANGQYFIIAVPVGTYRVQASLIGYAKKIVTNVLVSAEQTTTVDMNLIASEVEVAPMIIMATQDQLHKEVSGTQLVVSSAQIMQQSGVREINSFLAVQPGISETNTGYLSIRGGMATETGTMVNGMSYNNALVGNAETTVPLSAIDQISVLSGGYNAEYGNFRSGLVNVTTKSGTSDGYHGTFNFSHTLNHDKRFGPALDDVHAPLLAPYMDADVAFVGTATAWANNPYKKQQSDSFDGWISRANSYNTGKPQNQQATPLDMYLLYSWLFMATPDYDGLQRDGILNQYLDTPQKRDLFNRQKELFAEHERKETSDDFNFDGGFGGPIPGLKEMNGTFYLSNNSTKQGYVIPVTVDGDGKYTTLLTMKAEPAEQTTVTMNAMYKLEQGLSTVRPAFGDPPDAEHDGGFMPVDNTRGFVRNTNSSEYKMYWFDPTFFPVINQRMFLGGITINKVFNKNTYAELAVNYQRIKDESPQHGDTRDTTDIITWFGPFPVDEMPYGKWQFAGNHKLAGFTYPSYDDVAGIGTFRFRGKEGDLYDNMGVNQYRIKLDVASQVGEHHYLKTGIEYNDIHLDHNFWERWNKNSYNIYEFNYQRVPSQTGVYLQDQVTYEDMLANLGLRFDYWYGGGGKWPTPGFATGAYTPVSYPNDSTLVNYLSSGRSYIWDYWTAYDKTHPGFLQPIKNFLTISPRIGVSFPITDRAKFYFNYGHFRSNAAYYDMYQVSYRYTKNGLYQMANPNLIPPKTVQYELGAAYNFLDVYTFKIAGYYKDVTGEPSNVSYQNQDGSVNYTSEQSTLDKDIEGLELALTKQDDSWINGTLNFNYSLNKSDTTGKSIIYQVPVNDPSTGVYNGSEGRALPVPSVNLTVTMRTPQFESSQSFMNDLLGGWTLNLFGEFTGGSYTTWDPLNNAKLNHINNNIHWPDYYMVNMRLNKSVSIAGLKTTFYADIKNIFNIKVNIMSKLYAFDRVNFDLDNYLASLHLPMYNDPRYDNLRAQDPTKTLYIPGNDSPGDLRSPGKPYINDPNLPYFEYGDPREIWFGIQIDL